MSWNAPGFSIDGFEIIRSTIAPARPETEDHAPEWVLFGSPMTASGQLPSVVIAGDFHQVSDGIFLGCSAHVILSREDELADPIDQAAADQVAAELGPWVCEALWDFVAMHLRSLAGTSLADFDLPRTAPAPSIERLADSSGVEPAGA